MYVSEYQRVTSKTSDFIKGHFGPLRLGHTAPLSHAPPTPVNTETADSADCPHFIMPTPHTAHHLPL